MPDDGGMRVVEIALAAIVLLVVWFLVVVPQVTH